MGAEEGSRGSALASSRRVMKLGGWGDPEHAPRLPDHAVEMLRREVGLGKLREAPALAGIPGSSLLGKAADRLAAFGEVLTDDQSRLLHGSGKSYPDLVRQRLFEYEQLPDAVVVPDSADGVAGLLAACADAGVAVVPFGGGTSVVGGVEPLAGEHAAVVSLDLGLLDRLVSVDRESRLAVCEAGLRLPEAEELLGRHGLTLGHFPQSYEYASVGGCVATRSAGQASTGYGRIEEMVEGIRCLTPTGEIDLAALPASAAGPKLRELVVGSEGTVGVITGVALRVRAAPEARRFEGWFFRDFAEGTAALRRLIQLHAAPDVARLSDEEETRVTLGLAGPGGLRGAAGGAYLRARGYAGGCVAIFGWEGTRDEVARRRMRSAALARSAGGLPVGQSVGRAWLRSRFETPYLRDDMLARGVMAETLETATRWSNLADLHRAVGDALRGALTDRGTPPIVYCHVSHLYETGASLYFTFIARQEEGAEIEQWRAAKRAACDAIVAHGGALTHHHAVGVDHAAWLPAEDGELGVAALRTLKAQLDPAGIMNPGKLLPAA